MNDSVFDDLEVRLAKRLKGAADASYKHLAELEEYYRNQPPPAPPAASQVPLPAMTQEQWETEMARQPGLEMVEVDRMSADTVWVRITGRVMLDGGCASGMPLFGVEMLSDTRWGAHSLRADPDGLRHAMRRMEPAVVMIPPLRWWVGAHQPEGRNSSRQLPALLRWR
ncbi:MAG: hypothetical protein IPG92_15350 [Flavobacteriales bacterium]|nr:hypothetical protein [Flavobacteriales bacterium]